MHENVFVVRTMLQVLCCFIFVLTGCAAPEQRSALSELEALTPNPVWPPAPEKPRIQYLKSISGSADAEPEKSWFGKTANAIFGKEESEDMMLSPYGICVRSGKIYVTDPGSSALHVFDMQHNEYFRVRETKTAPLMSPIGVAVDENGEIYMTDSVLKKIFVFDKKGKYLRETGSDGLFIRPTGIAIDGDRLYVIDTHGHCVLVLSKADGHLLFRFGKNGSGKADFNYPTNIFISKEKMLYITDSMNFRVQIFDRDGNFISVFGKHGDGSGDFSKAKGIAVDSDGHIYVVDAQFDNVQIFDGDGRLLLRFGKTGRGKGEMVLPAGLFIDETDRIYVADSFNNRVQIFQYLK